MASKTWKVEGMSCQHCVRAVQQAAGSVAGVSGVEVNLSKGEVRFDYAEGRVSLPLVRQAIEAQGYPVRG